MIHSGRVDVDTATGSYPVLVGHGVARLLPALVGEHAPGGRAVFVSDSNVGPLHAERLTEACRREGLEVTLLTFPAGEASKSRERWAALTDEILEAGLGRDGCVVAVGGGVTTDLAGFVAATYLRGVPIVQVPTSYLAMIDASVGGKTGVDTPAGKNLVGAFHPPAAVVADTELLRTLPERERREGLVEGVKHGAILDAGHLCAIEESMAPLLAAEADVAAEVVLASVRIKAGVVSEDEREAGYRQVLNFGHTIGHAIEAASGYDVGHGTAVALGMLAEAEIGERTGVTEAGTVERLAQVLEGLVGPSPGGAGGQPASPSPEARASTPGPALSIEGIVSFLGHDKKVKEGRPRYVLLERVGKVAPGDGWTHDVADELPVEAARSVLDRWMR